MGCSSFLVRERAGLERALRKQSGGLFLARGRVLFHFRRAL
nr:MAG TPA: hypothetical protein [Caudoviricetes sp.]